MAHGMAIASEKISAEVIDADEFRDLAAQFNVPPVPKTIINGRTEFLGAAPETFVLEKILETP